MPRRPRSVPRAAQPPTTLQVRGLRRCRGDRGPDASHHDLGGARPRAARCPPSAQADPRRAHASRRDDCIHVFAPGPPDVTLPFTGIQLQGLDVEPSVITDYKGVTALAFHAGTATGSDGRRYNLETDMRAMEGTYVADGRLAGGAACSASYESTCSSPVRAPRSMTSTAASSPRACSGWWSCPTTPSRSATTGGGRPWKPRTCACSTASSSADRSPSRPRSASRSGGRPPGRGNVAAAARGAATDPAAFLGRFADARSTGSFSGSEVGFSFKGRGRHRPRLRRVGPRTQRYLPVLDLPASSPGPAIRCRGGAPR